ncbi:peptidase A24A domain protein [Caldicellulosiruptor saccharolyticus DSM 8903]|uniref:Peptidase A24A domain protein n=1 Tax=Caldicellulosiruptor saccharolyticus (strain ATCC 43494 / DSM 8903 / Tp8T 6331) TaxID=351627 RepID=A4XIE4_CALS8|nr:MULTISPECIES: A24 family peptidase [Caldicellulosiruptor]ABP66679.1 peptidase A24A domain protein [Caldicellulosiruptor saccharolyticus DSM 8903]
MLEAIVGTLGLVIGSFLNVCIYRIPRGESIIFPSSHCPNCGKRIRWFDLIPVLSFIILKGKCRYCKSPISPLYPVVEMVCCFLAIASIKVFGMSISAFLLFVIGCVLLYISVVDFKTYEMSVGNLLLLAILKLAFEVSIKGIAKTTIIYILLGPILNTFLVGLIYIISRGIAMGLGDVLLLMAGGIGFSVRQAIVCNFVAFFVAFLYVLGLKFVQSILKGNEKKREIPFGPFISIGIFVSTVAGERIADLYYQLIIVR